MDPLIDRNTGSVHLDKQWTLTPGLSVEHLANLIGNRLSGTDRVTRWFSHIPVKTLVGDFNLTLVFSGEVLMAMRAQPKIDYKSNEIDTKAKMDAMLNKLLGPPTNERFVVSSEIARTLFRIVRMEWPKGAKELTWELSWGRVISSVDSKDVVPEFKLQWKI
ncbi:MAG: hypothetical protein P4L46_07870 [Fimbriimonas sp.]|nr:hypothetical protein [Fimbriimonas sp.]